MRALIQEVRDADESWVGHDPDAAGRYWAARGALDAACHPSTIDDDGLDAALRAIDAEVHQTQRRMIAALYWRAGDAEVIGRAYHRAGGRGSMVTARSWLEASSALAHAAQVMEAACPR